MGQHESRTDCFIRLSNCYLKQDLVLTLTLNSYNYVHFKEMVHTWWEAQSKSMVNVAQSVYGCLPLKCHVSVIYLYLDHSSRECVCVRACLCVCTDEWALPWWQPINSTLGDSVRRNSDLRAALVRQYGSAGIRELTHFKGDSAYACLCAHICCLPLLLSCHRSLTHGGPAWNSLMT